MTARSRGPGQRSVRPWMILAALVVPTVLVWWLVPSPFVRGIVTGMAVLPAGLLGVVSILSRRARRSSSAGLEPPPLPIDRWDYALEGEDLQGRPVDFRSFSGRILVLNVWATWCAPCVAEMPSLVRLRQKVVTDGVALACVTTEPPEAVRRFVAEKKLDEAPIYIVAKLPEALEARGIPFTLIIDRDGALTFRHLGAAAWDAPSVIEYLRRLATAPRLGGA